MSIEFVDHVKTNGRYGPTGNNRYYQPAQYHNANAQDRNDVKSLWSLSEPHQYCVFKFGDESGWNVGEFIVGMNVDNKKLLSLGTDDEKVAVFRLHDDSNENWHGYPVKTSKIDNRFDEFFCSLRDSEVISKAVCKRLVKSLSHKKC